MKFNAEEELREFILSKGCFDKVENERIYEKFFRDAIKQTNSLHHFVDFKDKKVLDVGACYGHYLIHFPQGSAGVDINSRMIEFAKRLGLEVMSANIEDYIPVESSSFDVIHCHNLLEHVTAPHRVLREFYRVLPEGGIVLIGVPNMDSPGYKGWKAVGHLYAYNKKSLSFLLERSGFHVLKTFVNGRRLPKLVSFIVYEKLYPQFSPGFYIVGEKIPEFKYSEKRPDISTLYFMKQNTPRRTRQ